MNVPVQIALIFLSVALLVAIIATARRFGRLHGWSPELQRKSIHVSTGGYALTFPWLFTDRWPVLVIAGGAVLVMLCLRIPAIARGSYGATLHAVGRHSYGDLLLAVAIGIVFFLSADTPVLYVLPVAVVTLSDAVAAMTGVRYGRTFLQVETGTKSAEGSAMFFLVTWIVAMILLLLMTEIGRANVVLLSLLVAAFGTLVEADSWHGFDNLFLPLGLHLFLWRHLESTPLSLLGLSLLFLGVLAAVLPLAPKLGLSRQAARAYTIAIFLICAAADVHNAVLPVMAILAHLAARRVRPGNSRYPDLDVLATVVAIAVLWLFIGRYFEHNTLTMYNLSLSGVALTFIALATGRRYMLAAGAAAVLFTLTVAIATWNEAAQLHGPLWPWLAAGFLLCLAIPMVRPGIFERYRGPRMLALSLPVPLFFFIAEAFIL